MFDFKNKTQPKASLDSNESKRAEQKFPQPHQDIKKPEEKHVQPQFKPQTDIKKPEQKPLPPKPEIKKDEKKSFKTKTEKPEKFDPKKIDVSSAKIHTMPEKFLGGGKVGRNFLFIRLIKINLLTN